MAIRLKNKEKIAQGDVLIAFKNETAYRIKEGDEFELILWYPYYGRTKLQLKNIETGDRVVIGTDWDCLALKK
jgi:hypothetical protein